MGNTASLVPPICQQQTKGGGKINYRLLFFIKKIGTVAKLAMRQPFVLFKGLTFQKLCLPGAFRLKNSAYQAHFAQGITIIKC